MQEKKLLLSPPGGGEEKGGKEQTSSKRKERVWLALRQAKPRHSIFPGRQWEAEGVLTHTQILHYEKWGN